MQDLQLAQALASTRDLARSREGDTWRRLEVRVQGLLERMHDAEPEKHTGTDLRVDRGELDAGHGDEVMAALLAVGEAPDEARARVALERLDLLDGGDGRDDDQPDHPERDPALTDEGW